MQVSSQLFFEKNFFGNSKLSPIEKGLHLSNLESSLFKVMCQVQLKFTKWFCKSQKCKKLIEGRNDGQTGRQTEQM